MNTTPLWIEGTESPRFEKLQSDLTVDVVVIGAGVTGITAAWLLKQAGAKVALLERTRWGMAETGHTTAHLTYVTDTRLSQLVSSLGRDHAEALWDAGLAALTQIHRFVDEGQIDCEFAWVPGYVHLPTGQEADDSALRSLREDARLAQEFHFDAAFTSEVPFMGVPGVRFANQAKFHPRKYLAALIAKIPGNGSHVFEETEAAEIAPPLVKANGHTLHCRQVFLATHVPLQGAKGTVSAALFQTKLAAYTTYAVGAKIPAGTVPEASFWDTADPYHYLRIDRRSGHDYALLGGADHKTGQIGKPPEQYALLEKKLHSLFPTMSVQHHWSGQVVETTDGLPYIGETAPHQFVATGFAGNGFTFGTLGAMMACDAFTGRKNPWRDLFDPDRKVPLGGVWDYLKENKDYPYYLAKDLLSRPTDSPLNTVQRGHGRILFHDGARVAAYRDDEGQLTVRSAICPHMGCVVRWNSAEKTWDCPCHGSRFDAKGTVIAGPAESNLAEPEA